ncbi:MAG TPA: hypothetical protein VI585_19300 [Candidatus Binatia bacterium]
MADVGEKCCFGAVELSQRFSALAFLLVSERIGHRRCHMASNEMEKTPVLLVEHSPGANSRNKKTGNLLLAGGKTG